jgi:hypothetical protein
MKHRYLFILEIAPVELGETYAGLPSHLTLMSRFFSEQAPGQLDAAVRPIFEQTIPINLTFGETAKLGPKQLSVHLVNTSGQLRALHNILLARLKSLNVEPEYPQFVGDGHKPHVTARAGVDFNAGDRFTINHAYLVEVIEDKRIIRSQFKLSGKPFLVFISGSINSGKTTTAKMLAEQLDAKCINVDDLNDTIPNFNLATDLDKSMDLAISRINECLAQGRNVVANYVVRQQDFERFAAEIKSAEQYVITLAPRLEVAQGKRGDRQLSDWEVARVKYHYDTGVASPAFGHGIDNSDINVEETVKRIRELIGH